MEKTMDKIVAVAKSRGFVIRFLFGHGITSIIIM